LSNGSKRASGGWKTPLDVKEQYERQLKELQESYGEAMLELRARKKLATLLPGGDEK
jgi:hypothetical protein